MSAQKSILSFFKPNSVAKRNPLMDLQNSPSKKFKSCASDSVSNKNESLEDSNDNSINNSNEVNNSARESNESKSGILTGDAVSATLSPNDKKQIENNRLQAKLKIISKTLPVVDPNMSLSWFAALEKEFSKPYFKELNNFVTAERQRKTIYPPENQVWTWTKLCELEDIKVVILGQDPYHNPGQAHGLCFSVPVGVQLPPSLINMYKELANNYEGFEAPKHGYLVGWAKQGILLLNAVLTVEARQPNSHKDRGWEKLTTAVIKYLSDNYKGIVFLLWGAYAQKKAEVVDGKKHLILKAGHPSPLSAFRGFFGCKHFIKCNELLEKQGKSPIKWDWLPKSE